MSQFSDLELDQIPGAMSEQLRSVSVKGSQIVLHQIVADLKKQLGSDSMLRDDEAMTTRMGDAKVS